MATMHRPLLGSLMSGFIVLLTPRDRPGAELYAVATDGRIVRAGYSGGGVPSCGLRRWAEREAAERWKATHEGQGRYAGYRMIVSDGQDGQSGGR